MIVRTRLLATAIAAILVLAACGKEDEQANAAAAQINAATKGGPAAAAGSAALSGSAPSGSGLAWPS